MPIDDFLRDLFHPDLAFLQRALVVSVLSSLVCGVVGCHVVLRGMAFIGDAVAHAVFPGLAVAFVAQGSLVVGGIVAGVATAVLAALLSHHRRLRDDAVIGVLLVASFSVGLVVISRAPGYAGSLQDFLFGSLVGIRSTDVGVTAGVGAAVLAALAVIHRPVVTVSLDRETAQAMGLPTLALDVALAVCVSVAIVMSLRTIGNILVLALLVAPAATARLLTDRLVPMMMWSAAIGGVGSIVGVYLSWSYDLPTGATIVLVLTALFALAWLFAPRHGTLTARSRGL